MNARQVMEQIIKEGITERKEVIKKTVARSGCCRDRVSHLYNQITAGNRKTKSNPVPNTLTRDSFMEKYDTSTKTRLAIRNEIERLKKDDDGIIPETEFRAKCGNVSLIDFRRIASEEEFKPFQFVIHASRKDTHFWASAKTVIWAVENIVSARKLESS